MSVFQVFYCRVDLLNCRMYTKYWIIKAYPVINANKFKASGLKKSGMRLFSGAPNRRIMWHLL
ncbi:hypothetical protein KUTeg_006051, partial [Tegillarca granosa]